MTQITAEAFLTATGREPENDDLERANCPLAGESGHYYCGWDRAQNRPAYETGCNVPALKDHT
jgi:hypothetical protein